MCPQPKVTWLDLTEPVDESVLAPDEIARAGTFRAERDRIRFTRRRAHLRHLLAQATGAPAADLEFDVTSYGKPAVRRRPDIHFSTSSSGDLAVIALGPGELGVDIEHVVATQDLDGVAAQFFAGDERDQITSVDDFYRCWTRKEAYVKAIGQGLSYPLDSFAVEVADVPHPRLLRSDGARAATITDHSRPGVAAAMVVLAQ